MNSFQLVRALLEDHDPYSVDDPLEKQTIDDFPAGFRALDPKSGDVTEFVLREKTHLRNNVNNSEYGYKIVKLWDDEWSKKRRSYEGHWFPVASPEEAEAFVKKTAAKWSEAGWTIELF